MSDPAVSLPERYSAGRGRSAGFILALLAEGLLVVLVLTLGSAITQRDSVVAPANVVRFRAVSHQEEPAPAKKATPKASPKAKPQPQKKAEPEKAVPKPVEPKPAKPERPRPLPPRPNLSPKVVPRPPEQKATTNTAPQRPSSPPAAGPQQFGPPDTVGRSRDTPLVSGSGPNGERLYAASWYREPYKDELDGYLSTATGPGWGLIACRTAPDYRVENCVAVDEYPAGSNINRAILAAAWQFKVRPPQIGGAPRIGEWVRIRIDYGTRRQ